ncbi:MAG: restriction endonuclease, partial [Euryarchaeota archaeon]|nr:restriction endonuclease [Euryarchaeota archaeon]
MKHRLRDAFGDDVFKSIKIIGEPTAISDVEYLAKKDPYQFQWWALGLVGARPVEEKKGADKGIDGRLYFFEDAAKTGEPKQIIFSVKAGKVQVSHVRDLRGVVEREKAAIGVLICLEEPTQPMRTEAASADFYKPIGYEGKSYPRIQILTIADLL